MLKVEFYPLYSVHFLPFQAHNKYSLIKDYEENNYFNFFYFKFV